MPKTKKKVHHRTHHKRHSHHLAFLESLGLVALSFVAAFILSQVGFFHEFASNLHSFGYIGIFITGMFFVSVFAAAPATVILLLFAETHPLWQIAVVAGLGTVIGDSILLVLLSKGIDETLAIFPKETGVERSIKLLRHTKYRFLMSVAGALVLATPLPDELGLMLMGISKIKSFPFAILTFVLNTIGIYFLLMVLG